jgi:serine/threonine-protein kinase
LVFLFLHPAMNALLNNRYRLLHQIGRGGFGETFLAEDTHMPSQRRCAIKQLKPLVKEPRIHQLIRDRFQREAAILEQLSEENRQIPRLYAYFSENQEFYLVQEWVDGETLTQLLKRGGLFSEAKVRELLLKILTILEFVHSRGIVHRDIKPDNIMVRNADSLPVLIDFGAVRETMATQVNSQGDVTSSIAIGTPGFMSSEQAAGRPIFASDLYSLGLTAIYLLTGKSPQQLATDVYTGEILWQKGVTGVSPELAIVLGRAVQSHPRDRYPTATAMREALENPAFVSITKPQLSSTTISDTLATTQPIVSTGFWRNSWPWWISGVILTAIATGVGLIGTRSPQAELPSTPTNNNSLNNRCYWKVNAPESPANVLSSPDRAAASVLGQLNHGTILSVLEQQPNWLYINDPIEGWVIKQQTTLYCEPQTVSRPTPSPPAPTPQPPSEPVPPSPSPVPVPVTPNPISSPLDILTSSVVDDTWLSSRRVTEADLVGKNAVELSILRNSLFARKGRKFNNTELQNYFNRQPWYRPRYEPDQFPSDLLSPLEAQNAAFILQYQNQHSLRWIP